jgi:hypothetical protein
VDQKEAQVISSILASMANNFGVLFPSYWTQYGFTGAVPAVSWLYGPKYLTQQNAPNQIVAVLGDEPFAGSEVHAASGPLSGQPAQAPRELSRLWTRIHFYCWGQGSTLSNWTTGATIGAEGTILPTPANQNGFFFQSTLGGTTGATEPTWPSTVSGTVVDGSVTWTCIGSVDSFRIYDTDVTDLMRIVVAAAAHYTAVGSYKPVKGTWYDRTDLFVMTGTTNKVSFDFLIPVVDLTPGSAQINTAILTGIVAT